MPVAADLPLKSENALAYEGLVRDGVRRDQEVEPGGKHAPTVQLRRSTVPTGTVLPINERVALTS